MNAYRTTPESVEADALPQSRARMWTALALFSTCSIAILSACIVAAGTNGVVMALATLPSALAVAVMLKRRFDPRWAERYRARVELRAERWMRDGGPSCRVSVRRSRARFFVAALLATLATFGVTMAVGARFGALAADLTMVLAFCSYFPLYRLLHPSAAR